MTLQSTGPITIADVYKEARKKAGVYIEGTVTASGITAEVNTYSANLSWIQNNTKPAYRDNIANLSGVLGYAYYQKNNAGNCDNGNCTVAAANCGNIQCTNCQITSTVNCVNCDSQEWLQPNCNCACTYNCVQSQVSYNCACACACACACGDACGG
jgi:hypothetical protein